jgi:hypothetical protein
MIRPRAPLLALALALAGSAGLGHAAESPFLSRLMERALEFGTEAQALAYLEEASRGGFRLRRNAPDPYEVVEGGLEAVHAEYGMTEGDWTPFAGILDRLYEGIVTQVEDRPGDLHFPQLEWVAWTRSPADFLTSFDRLQGRFPSRLAIRSFDDCWLAVLPESYHNTRPHPWDEGGAGEGVLEVLAAFDASQEVLDQVIRRLVILHRIFTVANVGRMRLVDVQGVDAVAMRKYLAFLPEEKRLAFLGEHRYNLYLGGAGLRHEPFLEGEADSLAYQDAEILLEWARKAYEDLPPDEALGLVHDLCLRLAPVRPHLYSQRDGRYRLPPWYLAKLVGELPLTAIRPVVEAVLPALPYRRLGGKENYTTAELTACLDVARDRGLDDEELAALSDSLQSHLRVPPPPTDMVGGIPGFVRFFAGARVGSPLDEEPQEGNFRLVEISRGDIHHPTVYHLQQHRRGEWKVAAELLADGREKVIHGFRWRAAFRIRRALAGMASSL